MRAAVQLNCPIFYSYVRRPRVFDDFIPAKQFELETAGRKPRQNLLSELAEEKLVQDRLARIGDGHRTDAGLLGHLVP